MSRTTRTIRADLPVEVWDRLAAEAAANGVPLGRHLRNLIVARDNKKQSRMLDLASESNKKGK